ncbi:hypothetical protein OSTOST_19038, partial [Ostertagia ostertagi]
MRHLLLVSVLLLSTVSVLVPLCAETMGPIAVIVLRFLMGVGEVIPWHAMARSPPLLVVFYSSIIGNMMIAMILVYIPVYFKDVLLLEVKQNGFYTALPHTCNLISKLIWGFLMDYLKKRKVFTATQTVKLSQVL